MVYAKIIALSLLSAVIGTAEAQTTLRIGLAEDLDTLDPARGITIAGRNVFASLCDKLLDIDANLRIIPQLATEWSSSSDQLAITMKLRPGVVFHDGEKFDAAAVKYNIERAQTLPESVRKPEVAQIGAVEIVDPQTARIVLKSPFSPLLAQMTDRAGMMVSPKAAQAAGAALGTKPVCAGPYRFVEWVQQGRIVVERFPDYWDKGAAKIDRVIYTPMLDSTVRLANLQSGQLDLAERVSATDLAAVRGNDRLRLYSSAELGYTVVRFNIANGERAKTPLGQDKRVREAFELAIDRQALVRAAFNDEFVPGNQYLPPSSPWYVKSLPPPKRDVERAKALLREAGVPNFSFTLLVPTGTEYEQVAVILQAMLRDAGFDMRIQVVEFITAVQAFARGDFQALLILWSGRVDPDGNVYSFQTCKGPINSGLYCNPEVDRLLGLARGTSDFGQRQLHYEQAMRITLDERPDLNLYHRQWFWGATAKLAGFRPVPDGLMRVVGLSMN